MFDRDNVVSIASLLSDIPRKQPYSTLRLSSSLQNLKSNPVSRHMVPVNLLVDQNSLNNPRNYSYKKSSFLVSKDQKRLRSQSTSPQQLASNLRTRLRYAKLKLENGWENQSLARLESRNSFLTSQPSTNYFYSLSTTTTTTKIQKNSSISLNTLSRQKSKELAKIVKNKVQLRTTSGLNIDSPNLSSSMLHKGFSIQSPESVSTVSITSSNLLTTNVFPKKVKTRQNSVISDTNKIEKYLPSTSQLENYNLPSFKSLNDTQSLQPLSLIKGMNSSAASQLSHEICSNFNSRLKSPKIDSLLNHVPTSQFRIHDLLN